MKSNLLTVIITVFTIIFVPISCISAQKEPAKEIGVSANVQNVKSDKTFFNLYRTETKETEKIQVSDYLCGVLAAEMPATYEKEALKAQAVAAYTFALYKAERTTENYDITDDHKTDQAFVPLSQAAEKWGDNAAEYTAVIKSAVAAVSGMYLSYENEIALTVYHAISSGKTANCNEVWEKRIPYLVSVDSSFDKTSPNYISTLSLSEGELKEKLKDLVTFSGTPQNFFTDLNKSDSGRVCTLKICNTEFAGADIQKALSLRSANFDVAFSDGAFTFTVYGYGHGVGMSQNGANAMAKQGSSFKEILYHYYPGTKIKT